MGVVLTIVIVYLTIWLMRKVKAWQLAAFAAGCLIGWYMSHRDGDRIRDERERWRAKPPGRPW
jgi:hypothetical protein